MSEIKIVHALFTAGDLPLAKGAIYQTLCGTTQENGDLSPDEMRSRVLCAACYEKQLQMLVKTIDDLVTRYNTHIRLQHSGGSH